MLDYKKIGKEFSKKLQEFDKKKLEEWLDYDANRDLSKLLSGKKIVMRISTIQIKNLTDPREKISNREDSCVGVAA